MVTHPMFHTNGNLVMFALSSFSYAISIPSSLHCVKSVQIRSYFWSVFPSSNARKYGPEITRYLETFHEVIT